MNKVILMGRVTKDLELRYSQSNMPLLSFTVAVNRMKKDEADFITCKAFDKNAENISKYFGKGKLIAIEGRLQTGSYEKDGVKHYTTDVMVDRFHFTGEKSGQSAGQSEAILPVEDDGELPF